jgi:hypothetical protein
MWPYSTPDGGISSIIVRYNAAKGDGCQGGVILPRNGILKFPSFLDAEPPGKSPGRPDGDQRIRVMQNPIADFGS